MEAVRLIISGKSSKVGKSLFCIAFTSILKNAGHNVSLICHGPEFIPGVIYQRVIGRKTKFIDAVLHDNTAIRNIIKNASIGANVVLIDGCDEFVHAYDELAELSSDAYLSSSTGTPVVYLVNAEDYSESSTLTNIVNDVLDELKSSLKELKILEEDWPVLAGVIVNHAKPHQIEEYAAQYLNDDSLVVGCIPKLNENVHSHLERLMQGCTVEDGIELSFSDAMVTSLVEFVSRYCNLSLILGRGQSAQKIIVNNVSNTKVPNARIGVAWDPCFCLGFQDNIDVLADKGAEIIYFSPLADIKIPTNIGLLYFPGAILNNFFNNKSVSDKLKNSIVNFYNSGGVIYSEVGGTAFLCEDYAVTGLDSGTAKPRIQKGVGLIPGFADRGNFLFNYVELELLHNLTDKLFKGYKIKAIDTGEWQLKYLRLNRPEEACYSARLKIMERDINSRYKINASGVLQNSDKRVKTTVPSRVSLNSIKSPKGRSRGRTWGELVAVSPRLIASLCYNNFISNPEFASALIEFSVSANMTRSK